MRNLAKIIGDVELYKNHVNDPDNFPLDDDVKKRVERYDYAMDLIRKYGAESKTARNLHKAKFGIDITTTRKDFYVAVQISGQTSIYNKDFCRYFAIMQAEKGMRMATDSGNLAAFEKFLGRYIDASGIKIEDPDLPDYEGLTIPQAIIKAHPELLGKPDPELRSAIAEFLKPKKKLYFDDDAKVID